MNPPALIRRRSESVEGQGTSWSHGSALVTVALRGLVVVVVVLAALGGIGVLLGRTAPPAVVPVEQAPSHGTRAEAFAEYAVTQWLVATAEAPGEMPQIFGIDARDLPETAPRIRNITAADSTNIEPGVWSVLVGADVTETTTEEVAEDTGAESTPSPIRRYFQIAVAVPDTGGVSALTLPSPTSSPQLLEIRPSYSVELRLTDPVTVAASEFLAAYLAGSGPLERLVAPGSSLEAPEPAPYTAVAVTSALALAAPDEVSAGDPLRVLVAARAESISRPYDVEYALTLAVRAGRWEVVAIDPAPAVSIATSVPTPELVSPTPIDR